jgi:hypothetical protein
MRSNLMVLAIVLVSGSLSPPNDLSPRATLSPTAIAAAQSGLDSASAIEGLSIIRQNWLREGGFLIAEVTFTNKNELPVDGVIISCDFFDPPDLHIGSRGNLIVRILPPGETTIGGIEFTMLKHNVLHRDMFGGSAVWPRTPYQSGDRGSLPRRHSSAIAWLAQLCAARSFCGRVSHITCR